MNDVMGWIIGLGMVALVLGLPAWAAWRDYRLLRAGKATDQHSGQHDAR